jgi:DNA polymerase
MDPASRTYYLQQIGLTAWRQRHFDRPSKLAEPSPPAPPDSTVTPAVPEPERAAADVPGPEQSAARPIDTATTSLVAQMDWAALEAWLAEQDHRGASRPVFGAGARDASLLVIGEAPGAEEDRRGEPFVGRAGQLLDRMLAAISHSRADNTYIANICKFRPPGNRDPKADEIAADRPVLERQIELLRPRAILALGRVAAQTLLDSREPLGKLRGRWLQYPGTDIPLLISYHPAYLLRSPQQKSLAWDDLRQMHRHLKAGPP